MYFNIFGGEDEKCWTDEEIWDIREYRAINIRPLIPRNKFLRTDRYHPNDYWISSDAVLFDTENTITKVINFLDLKIDNERLLRWREIHRKWHKIQMRYMYLSFNLDHILECIVNGWDYKLIDLTFLEEVIIQHFLIYRYDLNLKTWGLEKFPENTAELFQILEPNIHIVPSLYSPSHVPTWVEPNIP